VSTGSQSLSLLADKAMLATFVTLVSYFFDPEEGGEMFILNVSSLLN
jgi:hypothetical protein